MRTLEETKMIASSGVTPEEAEIYNGCLAMTGLSWPVWFLSGRGLLPTLRTRGFPSNLGRVRSVLEAHQWSYGKTIDEGEGIAFHRPKTTTFTAWEEGVCTPSNLGDWCCKHLPVEVAEEISIRLNVFNRIEFSYSTIEYALRTKRNVDLPFWWVGGFELAYAHKGWTVQRRESDSDTHYSMEFP